GEAGSGVLVEPLCPTAPADCEVLLGSLLHRYRFDGTGTTVTDSIGGADGVVRGGATLQGEGELVLDGGYSGQYVDLPNHLISGLEDATLELWVVWNGGAAWQRVFDFGDAMANTCYSGGSSAPEGQPGACGRTFLNLTPATDSSAGSIARVAFMRQPGDPTTQSLLVDGPRLTVRTEVQLVVVIDDTQDELRLYVDGELGGSETFVDHLADINDINNWLGRSQFSSDSDKYFAGVYRELRIYGAALGDSQVATSFAEGPDAPFLE
ncbi:MAG TPA: LamG domain-containing protein, partial [Polyangiaceae bacterium]|nr:LamG domain-containing protein [Polyangiaceae bacterium]